VPCLPRAREGLAGIQVFNLVRISAKIITEIATERRTAHCRRADQVAGCPLTGQNGRIARQVVTISVLR
jgi:hypothetical protein